MKWWHHIFSVTISVSVLAIIFNYQKSNFLNQPKKNDFKLIESFYFENYSKGLQVETTVSDAIKNGKSIVLFGSSELANNYGNSQIPYDFFNQNSVPISLVAFGHAGNQCLSILSQLMSTNADLSKSKIVIFVSPVWFEKQYSSGTSITSFLEFVPERVLTSIFYANYVPIKYKNYLYRYINENEKNIIGGTDILKLCGLYGNSGNTIQKKWNSILVDIRYKKQQEDFNYYNQSKVRIEQDNYITLSHISKKMKPINWDSLKTKAIAFEAEISTNNEFGIQNENYNKYIKDKEYGVEAVPIIENYELKDYKMLVDYLYEKNCKDVLFIIPPMHPQIYKGLDNLTPTINEIEQYAKKSNYSVYNMWTTNGASYEKGVLTDRMHFGQLGWWYINRSIYNKFIQQIK